jgi:undecaprenyl-diphosphatase
MIEYIRDIDYQLFWIINANHTIFLDYFFIALTQFGNGWIAIPLVALVIVKKAPRSRVRKIVGACIIAAVVTGGGNTALKSIVRRPRPLRTFTQVEKGADSARGVHLLVEPLRYRSLPSGHTTTAFSSVTMLVYFFGFHYAWLYIIALLVAYSRVYVGVHFPFDTAVGMLLGISGTYGVLAAAIRLFDRRSTYD